jgi:hypothetical protein
MDMKTSMIGKMRFFWASPVQCGRLDSEALLGGASCESKTNTSKPIAFEVSSKRRKGFPSETHVKRGDRVVGGRKELIEKLGRNDPCPCGSGRRFQALLHVEWRIRRVRPGLLFLGKRRRLTPMGVKRRTDRVRRLLLEREQICWIRWDTMEAGSIDVD